MQIAGYEVKPNANLTGALLGGVKLVDMDLRGINLSGACLIGADLSRSTLAGANLEGAELVRANLTGASLTGANLKNARMLGADLRYACMGKADLTGASLSPFQIVPEVGQFKGFKRVISAADSSCSCVIEILIPTSARRTSSLVGRKCRADKAKIVRVVNPSCQDETNFVSFYNPNFAYTVGKWIKEPRYDPDIRVECTSGIHFFMTLKEAEEYSF